MLAVLVTLVVQFILWAIASAVVGPIVTFSPLLFWFLFVLFVIIGTIANITVRAITK